jgi:hypothetical protein
MEKEKWNRTEKLTLTWIIVTILSAGGVIYGAFEVREQIRVNNSLAWRTVLENMVNEYDKMEVDHPEVACVYKYGVKSVDDQCTRLLRRPESLRKAMAYIDSVLAFFAEVKDFTEKHQKQYADDYGDWRQLFSRTDIVRFCLFVRKIDAQTAKKDYDIDVTNEQIAEGYARFKASAQIKD